MSKCEECGTTENLIEHHTSYESEVKQVLCRPCHKRIHQNGEAPKRPEDFSYKLDRDDTTVIVSKETRDTLRSMKRGGESYDALIRRLMFLYGRAMTDKPETFASWIRHYQKEAEG